MQNGARAYLATQVNTTTQGDLLVMLYDAAIKFLNQAKVEIGNKNYAQKGILISKTIDIVGELANSLNKEKGGELAQNLNSIYFFLSTRLAKANLRMSTEMVDEVIHILSTLRGAYAQISGEDGVKKASEEAAKAMGSIARESSASAGQGPPPPGGFGLDPRFAQAQTGKSAAAPKPVSKPVSKPGPDTPAKPNASRGAGAYAARSADVEQPPSRPEAATEPSPKPEPKPEAKSAPKSESKAEKGEGAAPQAPRPTGMRARAAAAYTNSG